MYAASINYQIVMQEKKLSTLQNDLADYKRNLERIKAAKKELEQKKNQYENEFRAVSSFPNKILAIDSLGLIGVEKIQSAVYTAYSGSKEISFKNNIQNTLTSIQKKITSLEEKITRCKQNISTVEETIRKLKLTLAALTA